MSCKELAHFMDGDVDVEPVLKKVWNCLGLVPAQEFVVGIDLDFVPVAVGVEGGPEVVAHLLHSVSGWRLESVKRGHVSEGERSVDDDVVGSQSTFL